MSETKIKCHIALRNITLKLKFHMKKTTRKRRKPNDVYMSLNVY